MGGRGTGDRGTERDDGATSPKAWGAGSLWEPWKKPLVGQGPQELRFNSSCVGEQRRRSGWALGSQGAGVTVEQRGVLRPGQSRHLLSLCSDPPCLCRHPKVQLSCLHLQRPQTTSTFMPDRKITAASWTLALVLCHSDCTVSC